MKLKANRYKIHLIIGMVFLPFLLISAFTGFFRANYKWFWKENYKEIKNTHYEYRISSPLVDMDSAFIILRSTYGEIVVKDIKLKSEIGRLLYDINSQTHPPILMDANTGEILSPLSIDLAKKFADQYVKDGLPFKIAYVDNHYKSRKSKKARPVYFVEYSDDLNTKILIDKNNGAIEEEIDDNLKFGFWMITLHDYDFWDAKRGILSFVGAGLFILGFTGFYVWIKKKNGVKKGKGKKHKKGKTYEQMSSL